MWKSDGYTKYANLHEGETCLIIANGTGLANIPGPFLGTYPSFGANRIHNLWEKTGFAPTYYVCLGINHLVTQEQRDYLEPMLPEVDAAFVNRFVAHKFRWDEVYGILGPGYYGLEKGKLLFSYDPLHIMGVTSSVVYCMLQIAYYMGFHTSLIVGLDHHYAICSEYKHFYADEEAPLWDIAPGDRQTVEQWFAATNHAFEVARKAYENAGRRIVNLSVPTECEVFEKGDVQSWS